MANQILPFCPTDTGTNLLSQVDYASDAQRDIGNQPGIARSKLVNKAMRQSSFIASQVAQYIADKTGDDVLDDGNASALLALIVKAFDRALIEDINDTGTISDYTDIAECSGTTNYTVTLPTASSDMAGKCITIKKTGATGTITLDPAIDGVTVELDTENQFINVYCNGSGWAQRG